MPYDADPADHENLTLSRLRAMHRDAGRKAVAAGIARSVGAAAVLIGGYALMPLGVVSNSDLVLRIALVAGLVIATIIWQLWAVERAALPQLRAFEALVVTVSVIVFTFAAAYLNMSRHDPDAFNEVLGKTSALYFTMTTLTTVGYGDIAARTDAARIVVMMQMVANVVVIGSAVKLIMRTVRFRLTTPRATVEGDRPAVGLDAS